MRLSPSVKRACLQHDIDPARITGTGRNGRVTRADVDKVVAGGGLAVNLQTVPAREAVACHLIGYDYDEAADAVTELTAVPLAVRLPPGLRQVGQASVLRPGLAPVVVPVELDGEHSRVILPAAGLYSIVVFGDGIDQESRRSGDGGRG